MKNPLQVWLVKSDSDYASSVEKFWVLKDEAEDYAERMSKIAHAKYYVVEAELLVKEQK